MKDNLKVSGWALNSEYFCTVMHMLRDDASYAKWLIRMEHCSTQMRYKPSAMLR